MESTMEEKIEQEVALTCQKKRNKRVKQLRYRIGIWVIITAVMLMSVVVSGKKLSSEQGSKTIKTTNTGVKAKENKSAYQIEKAADKIKKKKITNIPKENAAMDEKYKRKSGEETKSEIETGSPKRQTDGKRPMIALTFDDGPGKRTMELLQVLEQYGARATFFTCGTSLSRSDINVSKILKKMDEIGCDIGNHTMGHKQLDLLNTKQIKNEVKCVNSIIEKYTGHEAALLRPPYGAGIHNKKVINSVRMPMIYWSVDTMDWKTRSRKATVKSVMNNAQEGDIVLMHDIHDWSVDAAKEVIPKLIKKGYQLVTVSELAAARGIKMEDGVTYFDFKQK